MAKIWRADGTIEELRPLPGRRTLTLEQLQDAVGGLIEFVQPFDDRYELIVNEEGKCLGLPLNARATEHYPFMLWDVIVGDVVYASREELR